MFKGIISTSLRFFDTNPSGRILNLFSRDLGTLDEYLPKSLLDATQSILVMTGSVLLTVAVKPYFVIPIFFIGIVFVYVRKVYLNSSKDVKRMEGISMSEVKLYRQGNVNFSSSCIQLDLLFLLISLQQCMACPLLEL